jgi:hypothetical protein
LIVEKIVRNRRDIAHGKRKEMISMTDRLR